MAVSFSAMVTLCGTSILTLTMIAVERYLSVFHPFCHGSWITLRKTLLFVAVAWIKAILTSVLTIYELKGMIWSVIVTSYIVTAITVNAYCYFRILWKARKVRRQIQSEEARLGQVNTRSSDKRYVSIGVLILISTAICYAPAALSNIMLASEYIADTFHDMVCWQITLVVGNSLVNPLITCKFCPVVRSKVSSILTLKFLRKN